MDDVRTAVERCGAAAGLLTTSADDVATSAEVRMNRIVRYGCGSEIVFSYSVLRVPKGGT